jgi:DNA excision repair protein ERCC-2
LDLSEQVDLVIGDVNYALDPSVAVRRHFGDQPEDWIVVVDEVHQLAERARGWYSPKIEAEVAWRAVQLFDDDPDRFGPFASLARRIAHEIEDAAASATGSGRGDDIVCELPDDLLAWAAETIDQVGLDYALRRLEAPLPAEVSTDPFQELCRSVLRFRAAIVEAGDETVAVARVTPGAESIGLLCLDPSPHVGPRRARLGGFAGCSATIQPAAFHRDLLGLPPKSLDVVQVPSPFPPEHRAIMVAPRISTLYRDRAAHAERTAQLLQQAAEAVPGNVAIYFPSFAMLDDIAGRWTFSGRELLMQRPGMSDSERADWLARLAEDGPPIILAAALGGVFAEGIDLPPGALSAVFVAGPALPPVGLERDLLRQCYDDRYGEGYRYASLIPGLTRVVQAAGRLIRRPEDRGIILLVGRRFRWRDIAALLPSDWAIEVPEDPIAAIAEWDGWTRS